MRSFLCLLFLVPGINLCAQNIGIGTNNPQQKLHIAGGLRIDTLSNGTDSGIVTHTKYGVIRSLKFSGNSNDVLRGDGSFGTMSSSGSGWGLTGNAGTSEATNFIGTTDNSALKFRVGNLASGSIEVGTGNTSFGYRSFKTNTIGSFNTAMGSYSLEQNTEGYQNVAVGYLSLGSNTLGIKNTSVGFGSLQNNTTGSQNCAIGHQALVYNTTGIKNTAVGISSQQSNESGNDNTSVGASSLYSNAGNNNTAVGAYSLLNNSTGNNNTAVGWQSLYSNGIGYYNTATGIAALYSNSTGTNNSALGAFSQYHNTNGSNNTSQGNNSLLNNLEGYYNSAVGSEAMKMNTNGNNNTAIGHSALYGNTLGSQNIAIGDAALTGNQTGIGNIAIGANSGSALLPALNNTIAIGYGVYADANNQVRIGNPSNTSIGGYAAWTNLSDGRFKKDVREDVKGLDFIKRLRPVTYSIDYQLLDATNKNHLPNAAHQSLKPDPEKSAARMSGFIAQEVEVLTKETGFAFGGVDAPKNKEGLYGLRYSEFVVPLVKAVQEQQDMIEKLQKSISELQAELNKIKDKP
jgi:hypothetical protein